VGKDTGRNESCRELSLRLKSKPTKTRAKRSPATPITEIDPLAILLPRSVTARILGGKSVAFIKRLEASGQLRCVRLNRAGKNSQCFNLRSQVMALAEGGDDEA
jgi:hypothetical protein